MITVDEIKTMWAKDAKINENHLEYAEMENGILHSKYIDILVDYKRQQVLLERDFNKMKKVKIAYYKGTLSQEQLKTLGWEPFQLIITNKNELMDTLLLDDDLNDFNIKVQEINIGIELLQSIIDKIKNKSWQIKNIIEIKKFNAGYY